MSVSRDGAPPDAELDPVDGGHRRRRDDERLLTRRARSTVKLVARSLYPGAGGRQRVVLIFGCQRSGTTMLQQTLLDRSWRIFILEEHDRRLVGVGAASRGDPVG